MKLSLELKTIITEASNKNTSAKRLKEIFLTYSHSKIKKALATNPNTPLEILFQLGEEYPAQLLENSALNLSSVENPSLFAKMPEKTLINILKLPQTPPSFVLFALNNLRDKNILPTIISTHTQLWNDWRQSNSDVNIYLTYANFNDTNLKNADLSKVNLRNANFKKANLKNADLIGADLTRANLSDANLKNADLIGVDLSLANLSGANLTDADLSRTNLIGADVTYANLSRVYLMGANLSRTNLIGADLTDVDLTTVKINSRTKIYPKWLM